MLTCKVYLLHIVTWMKSCLIRIHMTFSYFYPSWPYFFFIEYLMLNGSLLYFSVPLIISSTAAGFLSCILIVIFLSVNCRKKYCISKTGNYSYKNAEHYGCLLSHYYDFDLKRNLVELNKRQIPF